MVSEAVLLVKSLKFLSAMSYSIKLYLGHFYKYIVNLKFLDSLFLFLNGPQALYVNPGCLKYISGIKLSPANKILFTLSFILYLVLTFSILFKQKTTNYKNFASRCLYSQASYYSASFLLFHKV